MWDESLFRRPEVFDLSYVPEVFNFRDNELEAISHNVNLRIVKLPNFYQKE